MSVAAREGKAGLTPPVTHGYILHHNRLKEFYVMDPLAPIRIACIIALIVSVATAVTVAWQNRGSRNLALATGALSGITLLFLTQLYFELQSTTMSEFILTELGIDRAKPEIRQWVYGTESGWRPGIEVSASNWLSAQNPNAFSDNREKITSDLVLFSLASFLQTPEAQHWDVRKHSLVGKYAGGIVRFQPTSAKRQCALVTPAEIRSQLSRSGNLFAGAPLLFEQSICLPPSSVLEITANSLIIRNHVCELIFTIESSGGVGFLSPRSGEEVSKLLGGESRFETRTTGLDVQIRFLALRIGQRDGGKYREWSSALVNGVRDWFEK